jgi:hypothetical protein
MFRFVTPRRTVFSMSRLPMKLEAQHQRGQVTNIQKVHFKKPKVKIR